MVAGVRYFLTCPQILTPLKIEMLPRNAVSKGLTFERGSEYDEAMANVGKKKKPGKKAIMLGLALDGDGHKRVTSGENFLLAGGTKETHEVMTEKVIKINEKLAEAGKRLEEVSSEEFDDIASSVGLHKPPPPKQN